MNKFERDDLIQGTTYKIKPPVIEEAVYITINNSEIDGVLRPVEIFINSKHMQSFQWVNCVSRIISSQFKHSIEMTFSAIDELKDTYDLEGGYIIPKSRGKRANSIISHIGYVIEKHCKLIGLERPKK